jgi:hypothetical protein
VCDLETSRTGGLGPIWLAAPQQKENFTVILNTDQNKLKAFDMICNGVLY